VKSLLQYCAIEACALVLTLVPSFAKADEPPPAAKVQARVEEGLLKPLAEQEKSRSRFSRARMPPRERRARVTQVTPTRDPSGRQFMAFALDVKYGSEWRENDVVGCAYLDNRDLFVKLGSEYRPSAVLLGQAGDAVQGVCVAARAPST
jgi:hypothetical protein